MPQNAEIINFNAEDPMVVLRELTGGIGVDRVIDAVGVDSERPKSGPAAVSGEQASSFDAEVRTIAPDAANTSRTGDGELWKPGDGPSQAARWAVEGVAKAGTIGVIGVYPQTFASYPFGEAFNKNLTIKMGNANHRRYVPELLDRVLTGVVDPLAFISEHQEPTSAIEAYQTFDQRRDGWLKTVLDVA